MKRTLPDIDQLQEQVLPLAKIVSRTCYLPNPDTVKALRKAVFPTIRDGKKRITFKADNGKNIAMFDDNTTPIWAVLWSHGINVSDQKGWSFAHVWPVSKEIEAYTHLANLLLVPECLSSLTDKNGPASAYLRWHAKKVYGWTPPGLSSIEQPTGYDEIKWRYMVHLPEPLAFIMQKLKKSKSKRALKLLPLMEDLRWHE